MEILFVDDMEIRHVKARSRFIGEVFTSAYTAKEAISKMSKQLYDVVCLDHDLSEAHYLEAFEGNIPSLIGSGTEIAEWMAGAEFPVGNKPGLVVLHSLNPAGRKRMYDFLHYAKFNVKEMPFTSW